MHRFFCKKITAHAPTGTWGGRGEKNDFWIKFNSVIESIFYETEAKEEKIYSYRFVVNPKNSQKDQFYHFDYAGKTGILFIPMVYLTTENITQYFNDFAPQPNQTWDQEALTVMATPILNSWRRKMLTFWKFRRSYAGLM